MGYMRRSIDGSRTQSIATMRAVCALMYLEVRHSKSSQAWARLTLLQWTEGELENARHHYKALQKMVEASEDLENAPLSMRTSLVM